MLNRPGWWAAAREAQSILKKRGIAGCLVGTAALAVLGYDVPYADLDFICEEAPTGPDLYELVADPKYHDKCTSTVFEYDTEFFGFVHVNFIAAGERGMPLET